MVKDIVVRQKSFKKKKHFLENAKHANTVIRHVLLQILQDGMTKIAKTNKNRSARLLFFYIQPVLFFCDFLFFLLEAMVLATTGGGAAAGTGSVVNDSWGFTGAACPEAWAMACRS